MKPARVVTILFVSLLAVPLFAGSNRAPQPAPLAKARCVSLAHTHGAWRMQVECDGAGGAISMIDVAAQVWFRGEGMFSSWSQEQLRAAYMSLLPKDDAPAFEPLQLG